MKHIHYLILILLTLLPRQLRAAIGHDNAILSGYYSAIAGGQNNKINVGYMNLIGGGCNNSIATSGSSYVACNSFIGGGGTNCIDTTTHNSCYNSVVGGFNNLVCANTCYSAILGGCNNVLKHNFAGVLGTGLTSAADCAIHVNCIIAPNTPYYGAGGFPSGTYTYKFTCDLAATDKVIVMI